jgi:hypothetical protein
MTRKATKTGKELERWVANAYREMGARKVEHDVELAGNQIDVYVELETPGRLLHRIAVEAKDWTSTVGIDIVNEFAIIVNLLRTKGLIDEGVIVSASGFSKQARNAGREHSIRLLESADLTAMVAKEKGTRLTTSPSPVIPDGPSAPQPGESEEQRSIVEEQTHLEQLLDKHQRNLYKLREQVAIYGAGEMPLRLLNQIESEEREIYRLQAQLAHQNREG